MKIRTILTAMSLVLIAGCAPQPGIDLVAEPTALLEAAEAYHRAARAKDVEAVVALYDEEAIMVPPNAARVEGIEGVGAYRFGFIETPGVELEFEIIRAEVSASGDMGWTIAIVDITIDRPDGPPGNDRVRDLHAWKKQNDGSWKVVVDMWSSELPTGG